MHIQAYRKMTTQFVIRSPMNTIPIMLRKLTTFIGVEQKEWTFVPTHQYTSNLRYKQVVIKDKFPDWMHDQIPPDILTKMKVNQVDTKHHLLHCILFCLQYVKYYRCDWTERKNMADDEIDKILRELNEQRGHPIIRGFGRNKLQSLVADQDSTADPLLWLLSWYYHVNLLIVTDYQTKLIFSSREYDPEIKHLFLLHNSQGWLSPISLGDAVFFDDATSWLKNLLPDKPRPINQILDQLADQPRSKLLLEEKLLISSKTEAQFLQQDRYRALNKLKATDLRALAQKHNLSINHHGKKKLKSVLAEELSFLSATTDNL